jgi:hypothetical protein
MVEKETALTMDSDNYVATLQNQFVRVNFNLQNGTYNAIDKRDGSICISEAFFKINEYSSNSNLTYF